MSHRRLAQTSNMASKRNLYRPAQVKDNVGQRQPRKTLAQGRLITNGGRVQGSVPATGSVNVSHVSNTSGNISQLHQTSLVQGQLEESLFSPRRAVPHISEPKSPQFGHPAGSLDLSDSDDEIQFQGQRSHYQKPKEVLCIDASRQTVNPDMSEVDIRIGVDRSPVKIVCHSPARTNQPHRTENLSISGGQDAESVERSAKHHTAFSTQKAKGDHIDPLTAVQSIPMSPPFMERKVLQTLPTNYPQPNFEDSSDSDILLQQSAKNITSDIEEQASVSSDKEMLNSKEIKVTVTKHKPGEKKVVKQATNRILSSAKKDAQKRPDTGKKKGKIVQSRYMQATESKAKASLSARMDKSSINKSNKGSHSMEVTTPSVRKVSRKVHSGETKAAIKSKHVERPHTPDNQSIVSTGGKTSTPTMDGTMFSHDMTIDASAIHADASLLLTGDNHRFQKSGKTRSRLKQDLHDDLMGQSILSNASVSNASVLSGRPQKKVDMKSLHQQIDLLWEYNEQWAFLEAKAKKTLHEQEKQAMAQIHGLFEEVEELRKVKLEKEQQLSRLRHTNTTDHMAEVQRQCLGPVVNSLPALQKQYRSLAFALDTTRHQIPTKDIHLPEDEDQHQAKLEAQLLESERLLGEISATTRQEVPKIAEMANTLVAMETAVEGMGKELTKSRELLAATETLTMHECSLRVQEIQLLDRS